LLIGGVDIGAAGTLTIGNSIATAITIGQIGVTTTFPGNVNVNGIFTVVDGGSIIGDGDVTLGGGDGDTITLGGTYVSANDIVNIGTSSMGGDTVVNLRVDLSIDATKDIRFERATGTGVFVLPSNSVGEAGAIKIDGSNNFQWWNGAGWSTVVSTAYTLDQAYSASGGASSISVDAGDVSWNEVGAYSFNIDVTGVTGGADGFQILAGTDYLSALYTGANSLAYAAQVTNYDVDASGTISFNGLSIDTSSHLTGDGTLEIYGGSAASNSLRLGSTSHATKGLIYLGTASAYDEVNDRLGVRTTSPGAVIEAALSTGVIGVKGTSDSNYGVYGLSTSSYGGAFVSISSNGIYTRSTSGTAAYLTRSGTLSANNSAQTLYIYKHDDGASSYNSTGHVVEIVDNPINCVTIGGYLLTATIGATERVRFNPRVADGASAVAYFFDTANNLSTAGSIIASFRTNNVERFSVRGSGNFGNLLGAYGTSATNNVGIAAGTAPSAAYPADAAGFWVADRGGTADKAAIHIWCEDSTKHVLGDLSGFGTTAPTARIEAALLAGVTGIKGTSDTAYGIYGISASNYAVYGTSTSSTGVRGSSSSQYGVRGSSTSGYGGYFDSVTSYGLFAVSAGTAALVVDSTGIGYGANIKARMGNACFIYKTGTLTANDYEATLNVRRLVNGDSSTYSTNGNLINIDDNPINCSSVTGYIIKVLVDNVERVRWDPRVANGASAVAYFFDTANALSTAGSTIASFRTNNVERFSIRGSGNFGNLLGAYGTSATNNVGIAAGTAPSASYPADAAGFWVEDRGGTAGKASVHIWCEDGTKNVIGDMSGFGTISPTARIEAALSTGVTGVKGTSDSAAGVYGISASSYGVRGSSTSGGGVYGASSSSAGVVGGSLTGAGGQFSQTGTLSSSVSADAFIVRRTVDGASSYAATSNIIAITDNPTNCTSISGYLLTATIGSTERVRWNPRVVDGATAVAYFWDTANALSTAGAEILSLRNNAVSMFTFRGNGNFGNFVGTFGTNATKALGLATGVAPTSAATDAVQIYSVDRDSETVLGIYAEKAVSTIYTSDTNTTIPIMYNGTLYHVATKTAE
jgi:hypothetical protein